MTYILYDRIVSSISTRLIPCLNEYFFFLLQMGLMKKHPTIIPFMVYIAKEEKHLERFAMRAKYMALDPARNRYVKYIRNIRAIQEYLCKRADRHLIPKVNNTNMDRNVAAIHAAIFSCLRRKEEGESYYDEATNTAKMVDEEYRKHKHSRWFSHNAVVICRFSDMVGTDNQRSPYYIGSSSSTLSSARTAQGPKKHVCISVPYFFFFFLFFFFFFFFFLLFFHAHPKFVCMSTTTTSEIY